MPVAHPLVFVRHGATDWNLEHRYQGSIDTPLSLTGVQQAKENAHLIRQVLLAKIHNPQQVFVVTSPLQRARDTAATIIETLDGLPAPVADPAFCELSLGRWQGLTSQQVKDRYYEERKSRKLNRWDFKPLGGESMAGRAPELQAAVERLQPGSIVVTHSVVLRIIMHLLGDLPKEQAARAEIPHVGLICWDGALLHRQAI